MGDFTVPLVVLGHEPPVQALSEVAEPAHLSLSLMGAGLLQVLLLLLLQAVLQVEAADQVLQAPWI